MTKPFDYVTSVTYNKKNMMRDTENDAMAEKDYPVFIVNKALSYFADTVLQANEVNMNYHLDSRPQYEFLLNSIRRRKRFAKWVKNNPDNELDAICEVFTCSPTIAKQYHDLLSKEEIASILKSVEKGGRTKK